MEGLTYGIIAQTHYNFTRNKNGGKTALGEVMLILSLAPRGYCHCLKATQASTVVKRVS